VERRREEDRMADGSGEVESEEAMEDGIIDESREGD
jgi:hypothetical protein